MSVLIFSICDLIIDIGCLFVKGVLFEFEVGCIYGFVGEFGLGKIFILFVVFGLLLCQVCVGGLILFGGEELVGLKCCFFNMVCGKWIVMVFQDLLVLLYLQLFVGWQFIDYMCVYFGFKGVVVWV